MVKQIFLTRVIQKIVQNLLTKQENSIKTTVGKVDFSEFHEKIVRHVVKQGRQPIKQIPTPGVQLHDSLAFESQNWHCSSTH